MGEATKKERLNELLTITKLQAETRKRLVGRRARPQSCGLGSALYQDWPSDTVLAK